MRKLTFSLLLVVLCATFGAGWIFDYFYTNLNDDGVPTQLAASHHVQELGQRLADTLDQSDDKERFLSAWNRDNLYSINVIRLDDIAISKAMLNELKQGKALILETTSGLSFNYYLNSSGELLALQTPSLDLKQPAEHIRLALTGLFYASLLIVFLLWAYPLNKRLTGLRQATKEFGQGKLYGRISISPSSYIGEIEHEFNRMAHRIEDLVGDVKLLSASISHEMRTPLAKIQFGLDALQEETDPHVRKAFEQRIGKTVADMASMVDAVLRYGRLDYAMTGIEKSTIDLAEIVNICVNKHSDGGFILQYEKPNYPCLVYGEAFYLEILIDNLIGNAIKYGRSIAYITLLKDGDLILSISDDGEGIGAEYTETIFLPFSRGTGKQSGIDGFGIGLATAARIAFWHQARLTAQSSSVLSGAEFTLTFPCQTQNEIYYKAS